MEFVFFKLVSGLADGVILRLLMLTQSIPACDGQTDGQKNTPLMSRMHCGQKPQHLSLGHNCFYSALLLNGINIRI